MSAATALASGERAHPLLAAEAVEAALRRAGLTRAAAVLLYLSPEFSHGDTLAAAAVLAAARAAQTMQVAGAVTAGVFTEDGFSLERPCAAALILGNRLGFVPPAEHRAKEDAAPDTISDAVSGTRAGHAETGIIRVPAPRLSFFSRSPFSPFARAPLVFPSGSPKESAAPRIGCISGAPAHAAPAPVWQQGRTSTTRPAHIAIAGVDAEILVCHGFQALGPIHRGVRSNGHKLLSVDGDEALQNLLRELPASPRRDAPLPLHRIFALIVPDDSRHETVEELLARGLFLGIPLLAANADGSLELGMRIPSGHSLFWAQRQPDMTAAEVQARIAGLDANAPAFALAFSCLGRGPLFYDGEDRDLAAFTARFPKIPLLGAYCAEQISPLPGASSSSSPAPVRQMQNAFTLALCSTSGA